MYSLHKGYVPTKGKRSLIPFKGKTTQQLPTLEDVRHEEEYAGVLNDNAVLVDVDDLNQSDILLGIVEALKLQCRVYETTRGKHFLFLNDGMVEKSSTGTSVAVGLTCDFKVGGRNSYSVLKYNGAERPIVYDISENEEYQTIPKWLTPVVGTGGVSFVGMGDGDGRNQAFFNYILTLQSNGFMPEETRECIRLMNKYVVSEPLDEGELETILREGAFQKPSFYNGKTFLFDVFSRYLIQKHHIVKINGQLHLYRDGVYLDGHKAIESEMIQHLPDLNRAKRMEVTSYLDIAVMENTRPSSANYIAFNNGVYDLVADTLVPFTPELVITNRIPWDYNPQAYNPLTDHTLNKLACEDPNIRALLEEVIGYCFYRRNELRKSFILIGGKANGKSTYLDMVKTLLGEENTSALDLSELGDRFKTAELFGKLANIGDDIGDDFISNPAVFKKVVSGDRVNAERKGKDPFDFNNYSKMLFSANTIPRIKDKSGAVMDRLIIVPFEATFSKNDPDFDPYIKYKLREQSSMEYLIRLGVEGLKRVLATRGFTPSAKVEREIREYEEQNHPILIFFKELDVDIDVINKTSKELYRRYSEFCIGGNYQPLSNIEFSRQVNRHFGLDTEVRRINGKTKRVFVRL